MSGIAALASIDWSAIWAAITTITTAVAGVVAAIQNKMKNTAVAETEATLAFFDPCNNEAMTPTAATPDRSWQMSETTRASILEGKSDSDKLSILKQIETAESAGYVDYKIIWSGGYYSITYGLIESSYSTGTSQPQTATATLSRTSNEEIEQWYIETFGVTRAYYKLLFTQYKKETDRYTDEYKEFVKEHGTEEEKAKVAAAVEKASNEELFQRRLSGMRETEDNWGVKDGKHGAVNMIGTSGLSQAYYDAYVDCLQYRTFD